MIARPSEETVLSIDRSPTRVDELGRATVTGLNLDVIFPVLHGPYGEDGTIQGLLELANVPYVGAGVLASAVGMDKAIMKLVFSAHGLPVGAYRVVMRHERERGPRRRRSMCSRRRWATRCSSSRRISDRASASRKPRPATGWRRRWSWPAATIARSWSKPRSRRRARSSARSSATTRRKRRWPAKSIPSREFYDYEAKYIDDSSQVIIPAELAPASADRIRRLSIAAFKAIDCAGMARVDFLLSRGTGKIFLNEVNTIPGFTTISMYSKLWAATGLDYPTLLERLVSLALERHAGKQQLRTSLT